ncbi:MAG: alanine racemase [Ruminococcus sp.]|nr:alanine racemase [Ruminococcus sp.]
MNHIKINTSILKNNISYFKEEYKYQYYILDVSNNAFKHGMYLINYLTDFDYLYVNNLKDTNLIRNFNKEIPVIFNGYFTNDNILDLINNNIILAINSLEELKMLNNYNLYANLQVILKIDIYGYKGFNEKYEINDALNLINNTKNLELIGIISSNITENDYEDFLYTINELLRLNLKLYILNSEYDKKKIKNSNSIILNNSIYGINSKKKLFQKDNKNFKQIFGLYTTIEKIKKETKGKKENFYGIIPLGNLNGLNKITKVYINNKFYNINKTYHDYAIITVDKDIKVNDAVTITDDTNPLENYLDENTISYINILSNNIPITYENNILEKIYN